MNVGSVGGDEDLSGNLANLSEVVMSLFDSETSKTNGRLTSSTMLFGKFDTELVADFTVVSLKLSVKSSVTIDNDETEGIFVFEETSEILENQWRKVNYLCVEFIIAHIKEFVDGSERLEINQNFLFSLAIITEDSTAVNNKTIVGSFVVKLQS